MVGDREREALKTFRLLINSELKPDTSPRASHKRHLVSPDTRDLRHGFGGGHPSVWAMEPDKQNHQLTHRIGAEKVTYLNSAASSPQTSFAVFIG